MTQKEVMQKFNLSKRTLLNFRLGYVTKKNKEKVFCEPILKEGTDWHIELINSRATVIFTEEGIKKIQFTLI